MSGLAFILSLPLEISLDILSRLPIQAILTCKCVCKAWLKLISSHEFAERHLKLTFSNPPESSLAFYSTHSDPSSCKVFEFHTEPPNHDLQYKKVCEFDPKSFITNPNAVISLVGSVNGLLCLQDSGAQLDSYYVCNPLRNEWISIPPFKETVQYPDVVTYGFGVSSSSGQYKVVRINHKAIYGPVRASNPECIVYTLGGTGSWRSIAGTWGDYQSYSVGAFLNGYLHWLACDEGDSQLISRFDLEREVFEQVSPPFPGWYSRSLVILEGCLCYCEDGSDEEIAIWMMRDYGCEGSWTKQIVLGKYETFDFIDYQTIFPLKVFENGDVLVLVEQWGLFFYSSRSRTCYEIEMFHDEEVIHHIPSFLPLETKKDGEAASQEKRGDKDDSAEEEGNLLWGLTKVRKKGVKGVNRWAGLVRDGLG